MANLAIKGHPERGKEVIEILEMLGGRNKYLHCGESESYFFFIQDGIIDCDEVRYVDDHTIYTIGEFLEKFPYKVGDKVKIKGTGKDVTIEGMSWRNGCEVIYDTCYNNDCVSFHSAEELQPYKEETMESKPNMLQQLKEYLDNTPREVLEKEWNELSYLNEIGPTVDEYLEYVKKYRQSNQYPKTYEECCKVLNICPNGDIVYAGNWVYGGEYLEKHLERIRNFQKLLICRDAYWKIAGEQMGLGKSWEPDYTNDDVKFCICCCSNLVVDGITYDTTEVFVFPTAEIRAAFCENFKDLIEQCKELL